MKKVQTPLAIAIENLAKTDIGCAEDIEKALKNLGNVKAETLIMKPIKLWVCYRSYRDSV